MYFGVIRPSWDVEGGEHAARMDGHCFYDAAANGLRYPDFHRWEGMQGARRGDRIGMLLDLDQGSMTVWKNGEQLGVMVAEGLSGPLCWAVSLVGQGCSARIGSAAVPAIAPLVLQRQSCIKQSNAPPAHAMYLSFCDVH